MLSFRRTQRNMKWIQIIEQKKIVIVYELYLVQASDRMSSNASGDI